MNKIIITIMLLVPAIAHSAECARNEIVVATCNISSKIKKQASICASEDGKKLYYVFKRNNKPELVVNFTKDRKLNRLSYEETYTTYFGFDNAKYSYVFAVPEAKYGALAFLEVRKGDDLISEIDCDANSFGVSDIKSDFIDDVSESEFRNYGFRFP